jgi:hypothetical protein
MNGKKYFELTLAELQDYPIWVLSMDVLSFYGDEADELDDDPALVVALPDDPAFIEHILEQCVYRARARFTAANGQQFLGLVKCQGRPGISGQGPSIALADCQVGFYSGVHRPTPEEIADNYARLCATADSLFPLAYRVDAPPPFEQLAGELQGFHYLETRGAEDIVSYVR